MKKLFVLLIFFVVLVLISFGCATFNNGVLGKTLSGIGQDVVAKEPQSNYTKITNLPFDSELDPNVVWNESKVNLSSYPDYLNSFQGIPDYPCMVHIRIMGEMKCVFVFGENDLLLRYVFFFQGNKSRAMPAYSLDKEKQRYVRWYPPRDKSGGI